MEPKKSTTTAKKPINLTYERDKDREMVRGIFRYNELEGGCLEFTFRKYKGDKIEMYRLVDGEICTVPLAVAKHLNQNVYYTEHGYAPSLDGDSKARSMYSTTKKVHRTSFQSLEFMDIEELQEQKEPLIILGA